MGEMGELRELGELGELRRSCAGKKLVLFFSRLDY